RVAPDEADAGLGQGREEKAALGVVGPPELARRVVHVDERQPDGRPREQPAELARLVRARVDAAHQHPGQVHGAAAARRVAPHRAHELRDPVAARDGHEPLALLAESRRQREDEPVGMALVREALDHGQHARGADGDPVAPDPRARGMAEEGGGLHYVVIVLERLALPLEDDAGHRPLRRLAADRQALPDHLPGLEVAREAEPARLAERAGERAADLRRDADAPSRPLERDADGFERAAVGRPEEVLHERVDLASPAIDDVETRAVAVREEALCRRPGEPAHAVEVVLVLEDEARDDPPRHREVEREVGEPGGQRLGRVASEVRAGHGGYASSVYWPPRWSCSFRSWPLPSPSSRTRSRSSSPPTSA